MKTTLIVPTFNEADGVKVMMPCIKKSWVNQILIVDGGSTDGTLEYLKKHGCDFFIQKERGYGAGVREAIGRAGGEIIIEFTPDGNSLPEKIPELTNKMKEGHDMVIASRYKDGARSYDDNTLTRFGNWFFTTLINILFGAHYTDTQVAFRAYRKSSYEKTKEQMDAKGLTWCGQLSIVFWRNGLKVAEIPADEPKRIGGKRKMNPLKTGWKIFVLILKERFRRQNTDARRNSMVVKNKRSSGSTIRSCPA